MEEPGLGSKSFHLNKKKKNDLRNQKELLSPIYKWFEFYLHPFVNVYEKKKHFAKVFVYILAFCLEVPILIGSDSTVFNDVLAHRNNSSALTERVEVY